MSNEAKIGLAVALVALVAVLWFAGGRPPEEAGEVASKAAVRRGARADHDVAKADRVKERLAQLRAERLAATGGKLPEGSQRAFPAKLPTTAFNDPKPQAEQDDELDFETLRDMALIDEDPDNRIAAIWLLASLDDEEPVLPVLTQALSDPDSEVRMAAIQALSEFSEETPIDSLQMALQDNDPEIRFEALSIAAEMTDERVQPLIQKALDDPNEDVRSLAEGLADMEDTYDDAPGEATAPPTTPQP